MIGVHDDDSIRTRSSAFIEQNRAVVELLEFEERVFDITTFAGILIDKRDGGCFFHEWL